MSPGNLVCIDGGQTETRATRLDDRGRALEVGTATGMRHLSTPGGIAHDASAIAEAYRAVGGDRARADLGVGFSGWSGVPAHNQQLLDEVSQLVDAPSIVLAGDAVTGYLGTAGMSQGVVVVAGTGAVTIAADGRGTWTRIDGHGSLLGDAGSGFWIGRRGLRNALASFDGRGGSAMLLERAESRFGPASSLVDELLQRTDQAAAVASFSQDVADCAGFGDAVAAGIWDAAGRTLAAAAVAAAKRVLPAVPTVEIHLTGGLFAVGTLLTQPITEALRECLPACRVRQSAASSLDGVALLAREPTAAGWFPGGVLRWTPQ